MNEGSAGPVLRRPHQAPRPTHLKMTWYCTSARGGRMSVTGHDRR